MYRYIQDNTIPINKAKKLPPEEVKNKVLTGILFEKEGPPEISSYYHKLIEKEMEEERKNPRLNRFISIDVEKLKEKKVEKVESVNVRLSGAGGHGLLLAGRILGEAAAIYDNKFATQVESYGPEARGGSSMSDVVISNVQIESPQVEKIDILLALTQEACDRYSKLLKKDGILVADTLGVPYLPEGEFIKYHLPILDTAEIEVGRRIVTNVVALGAIVEISKVVSKEAIKKAVLKTVPKGTEELNLRALEAGFNLAKRILNQETVSS